MSRGIKDEYSYYGTAYVGETPVGVTNATATSPLVAPQNAPIVLSGVGKESMDNYYVTMTDFSELSYLENWTENEGVYTYRPGVLANDDSVFTNFRLFTAPCFLDPTEENSNYLTFAKATVTNCAENGSLSQYSE